MKTCSIEGCDRQLDARGWCATHYRRWQRYGDPLKLVTRPRGEAINQKGYKVYAGRGQHIAVAEKAMGKPLPKGYVVHHVNENKLDNRPENLVVCSRSLHIIIHQRTDAMNACGNPNWRKCQYCQQYDAPENLKLQDVHAYHKACRNARHREKQEAIKAGREVPGALLAQGKRLAIK